MAAGDDRGTSATLMARCEECTYRCRSRQHGDLVTSAVTKAGDWQLISYLSWVCHRAAHVVDSMGRSALHVAASCGRSKLVRWLVEVHRADVEKRDLEMGMTPLHRAVCHGQLTTARVLIQLGASLHATDFSGRSVLDSIQASGGQYDCETARRAPCDPYVWGENTHYSIGVERSKSQQTPLLLDTFRRGQLWVKQIVMSKYHTVFVCSCGEVFSCGHGIGGRLGHGNADPVLAPKQIRSVKGEVCVSAAVSNDHTVLLMESGTVWTFGMNEYGQLAHPPSDTGYITPKLVEWSRNRPDVIVGVSAARYHTMMWSKNSLYCVGLNGGQMGLHKDESKDKRILTPRKVTMFSRDGADETELVFVTSSDAAVAVATRNGSVFLLSAYGCRKLSSKLLNLSALSVYGGQFDSGVLSGAHAAITTQPVRLAVLAAFGELLVWFEECPVFVRYVSGEMTSFVDVQLYRSGVLLCSSGRVYTATLKPPKDRALITATAANTNTVKSQKNWKWSVSDTHVRLAVTRVCHVFRGVRVTCDSWGCNFAVLQYDPRTSLYEIPQVVGSRYVEDMSDLLNNASQADNIHDLVLKTCDGSVACHRFILDSATKYFSKLPPDVSTTEGVVSIYIDNISVAVLRQILMFVYTGQCDLTQPGSTQFRLPSCTGNGSVSGKPARLTSNPVHIVREAAKRLGVMQLHRKLDGVKLVGGCVEITRSSEENQLQPDPIRLQRQSMTSLYDVTLCSDDGREFQCHKCVLCARLEYFRLMLDSSWLEGAGGTVSLPVSSVTLSSLLDFCYCDTVPDLDEMPLNAVCSLLAAADQLIAERLKQLCEVAISRHISLKNCVELLEIGSLYNAHQLIITCRQFITQNLAALFDTRALDSVSDEIMNQLSQYLQDSQYSNLRPPIPASLVSPSLGHIRDIHSAYPVEWDELVLKSQRRQQSAENGTSSRSRARPTPPRRRTTSRRADSESDDVVVVGDSRRGMVADPDECRQVSPGVTTEREQTVSERDQQPDTGVSDGEFTVVRRRRLSHRKSFVEDVGSEPSVIDSPPPPTRYIPGITARPRENTAGTPPPMAITSSIGVGDSPHASGDYGGGGGGDSSTNNCDFPPLSELDNRTLSSTRSAVSQSSDSNISPNKSSRKQKGRSRKACSSTVTSPSTPLLEAPAWSRTPHTDSDDNVSLSAIMAEQQHFQQQQQKEEEEEKQKQQQCRVGSERERQPSGAICVATSPTRAWSAASQSATTSADDPQPVVTPMAEIIEQQKQLMKSRSNENNKSLHLIQIEERAVSELVLFYRADTRCDMLITVAVDSPYSFQPHWQKHKL